MQTDSIYLSARGAFIRRVSFKHIANFTAVALLCSSALGQNTWVPTATQAFNASAVGAKPTGTLSPTTPLHIVVGLKMQNPQQVQTTLRGMLTEGEPRYGQWLTTEQFVAQFAPTNAQVQAVEQYLTNSGFTNVSVEPNNLMIQADGTAAQAEAAFNTSLANYSWNGHTVFANVSSAQVPASLGGTVLAVLGLNNIVDMHSDIRANQTCTPPNCPTPAPANETYSPQQYQIAYDAAYPGTTPSATNLKQKVATGSKTAIGIIAEGDLTQVVKDLRSYEKAYDLPEVPVSVVNAGIASSDTSGMDEWDLDSQTSTGIAQQVKELYFYVATSMTDSDLALAINKAVSSNKVKAFNMSFGECEFYPYLDGSMLVDDEVFAEAALQGMTPFASADDNGSACPVEGETNGAPLTGPPDTAYPASSPYVIAVGGTNLFTNANYTYNTETAWEASGGGISYFETSPFWQSYTGGGTTPIVASSEAGQRGVPDVAMCAGGSYLAICSANIYVNGATELVGGTSLSSPLAVGSWARIQSSHGNKLGFAGPLIYQLATSGPPPSSPYFNDVILGGNGLFTAGPGYDYVTGLGSFDIYVVNEKIPSSYPK